MKKLIYFMLALSLSKIGNAQVYQRLNNHYEMKSLKVMNAFRIPYGVSPTLANSIDTSDPFALYGNTTDGKVYVWNGMSWAALGGLSVETDPLSFHISDTASKTWDWGKITGKPAISTAYIPLSGTVSGSPVTGDILFSGERFLYSDGDTCTASLVFNDNNTGFGSSGPAMVMLQYDANSGISHRLGIVPQGIWGRAKDHELLFDDSGLGLNFQGHHIRGLYADGYYGAYYDSNSYVQKKYVDSVAGSNSGGAGWQKVGDSITASDFIGSTNDIDVIIKRYGQERVRIGGNTSLTINTPAGVNTGVTAIHTNVDDTQTILSDGPSYAGFSLSKIWGSAVYNFGVTNKTLRFATSSGPLEFVSDFHPIRFAPYGGSVVDLNLSATCAQSSILDINSSVKGARPAPRMTKTERNAIANLVDGLQVMVIGEAGGTYLSWYDASTSGWRKVSSTAD